MGVYIYYKNFVLVTILDFKFKIFKNVETLFKKVVHFTKANEVKCPVFSFLSKAYFRSKPLQRLRSKKIKY